MPLGHLKLNNPNADPNPNITFIHAMKEFEDWKQAQKILEAVAAQFRRIMQEWGMGVTSLVEHEWNPQFAGRNWNAGERIELVLRRRDGSFAPYNFIMNVMCHELAHIKHMNHAHDFQRVNKQIRAQLVAFRAKGYFGDGFWSEGRSLKYPGAKVELKEDAPMFLCAGANTTRRKQKRKPTDTTKTERGAAKPGRTGRQTAIARKPGGRVTKKGAFVGEGNVLNDAPEMSTKGRRAGAAGAAEARAIAAEKRLKEEKKAKQAAGAGKPKAESDDEEEDVKPEYDDDESEWDYEDPDMELSGDEEAFLRDEMEHWDDDIIIVGERGGAAVSTSAARHGKSKSSSAEPSSSKGKGKKRAPSTDLDSDDPSYRRVKTSKHKSPAAASPKGKGKSSSSSKSKVVPAKPTVLVISDSDDSD